MYKVYLTRYAPKSVIRFSEHMYLFRRNNNKKSENVKIKSLIFLCICILKQSLLYISKGTWVYFSNFCKFSYNWTSNFHFYGRRFRRRAVTLLSVLLRSADCFRRLSVWFFSPLAGVSGTLQACLGSPPHIPPMMLWSSSGWMDMFPSSVPPDGLRQFLLLVGLLLMCRCAPSGPIGNIYLGFRLGLCTCPTLGVIHTSGLITIGLRLGCPKVSWLVGLFL